MNKIVIYDDSGDVIFSKTIDSEIKEVNIKTINKEIRFSIDKKEINTKVQALNDLFADDDFWK